MDQAAVDSISFLKDKLTDMPIKIILKTSSSHEKLVQPSLLEALIYYSIHFDFDLNFLEVEF
jgi:hypothetical protein